MFLRHNEEEGRGGQSGDCASGAPPAALSPGVALHTDTRCGMQERATP